MASVFAKLVNDGMSEHLAWRVAFPIIPVPILLLFASATLLFGTDHPLVERLVECQSRNADHSQPELANGASATTRRRRPMLSRKDCRSTSPRRKQALLYPRMKRKGFQLTPTFLRLALIPQTKPIALLTFRKRKWTFPPTKSSR